MILVNVWDIFKDTLVAINPPLTGTVNLFEALALVFGLIGMVLVFSGVSHAESRLRNLIVSEQNGVLRLIADENLRVEKCRREQLFYILIAVTVSAIVPSRSDSEYSWVGVLISLAFMVLIIRLVQGTYQAQEYRQKLDAKVADLDRQAQIAAIRGNRRKEDIKDD